MRTAIDVTLAKPGRTAEQLESMAVRVRHSIERAERMVDALLTLAISDQGSVTSREPVDLATAAEDALDATTAEASRLGLHIDAELEPALTNGDQRLLERLIGNLVENAVRHNKPGGWISLRAGTTGDRAFFRITNGGRVIPETAVPGLFEPFRRLDSRVGDPQGAGLGLSIARAVAAAHGAVLQARSQPAGGLDVTVTLGAAGIALDGPAQEAVVPGSAAASPE
jgi:signal transduction histidine kinase